jgi:FkbM family methyltransferase
MLDRLLKPWYVYQPAQLMRRAFAGLLTPAAGYTPLRTGWGVPIIADPARAIGRSIRTTGVYDIAVSEALARLTLPGDTVVDAGANVGYMTVLASVAAGPRGRVLSFEPHPALFAVARRNVDAVRSRFDVAGIELHQKALGDRAGTADLQIPSAFEANDGTSRIGASPGARHPSLTVPIDTLDNALGGDSVKVLKLDVEGFEPQVLRGASRALRDRRIRHIVFEEHDVEGSETIGLLSGHGYRLSSLGWSVRGLRVQPIEQGSLATSYEPANFIATLDPEDVLGRCRKSGWLVLGRGLVSRCSNTAARGSSGVERA